MEAYTTSMSPRAPTNQIMTNVYKYIEKVVRQYWWTEEDAVVHRCGQRVSVVTCLVLTIFNDGAYLTFKSIFHKALSLFYFDYEITLESVPGTNLY